LEKLTHGLYKHDFLIADNLEDLINSGIISVFMPHGVGHPVGLEVHDPYPSSLATKTSSLPKVKGLREEYPLKLKFDYPLRPGHVHTVEPGVYFIPYMLQRAKNGVFGANITNMINWNKIAEYEHLGGVRIEDCLAIGHDGISRIITQHIKK
jgi:Xaa-Pro dipeptidase